MSGSASPREEDLLEEEDGSHDGEGAGSLVGEEEGERTGDAAEEEKQETDVECGGALGIANNCVTFHEFSFNEARIDSAIRSRSCMPARTSARRGSRSCLGRRSTC
jgi:hypothetical protein